MGKCHTAMGQCSNGHCENCNNAPRDTYVEAFLHQGVLWEFLYQIQGRWLLCITLVTVYSSCRDKPIGPIWDYTGDGIFKSPYGPIWARFCLKKHSF